MNTRPLHRSIVVVAIVSIPLFLGAHQSNSASWWHYVPFDIAMNKAGYMHEINATKAIVGVDGSALYAFFKSLYECNNPLVKSPCEIYKIPKIIHQIWLGSPVPEVYRDFMRSWIDTHQGDGWEYRLWTDENIGEITLYNQRFYDETQNYGVKSDIARWEILYKYGGLYVDLDYECLRSFDSLHYIYDFYTGIQPLDTQMLQLGAALVGSCPGHPILKHCIETIADDWHKKGAPKKTGPIHFTHSFYTCAGMFGTCDIALPPYYVYPLGCMQKVNPYTCRGEWIQQGSYAVHWWSKSWMPKGYRPSQFRSIDNPCSESTWND